MKRRHLIGFVLAITFAVGAGLVATVRADDGCDQFTWALCQGFGPGNPLWNLFGCDALKAACGSGQGS